MLGQHHGELIASGGDSTFGLTMSEGSCSGVVVVPGLDHPFGFVPSGTNLVEIQAIALVPSRGEMAEIRELGFVPRGGELAETIVPDHHRDAKGKRDRVDPARFGANRTRRIDKWNKTNTFYCRKERSCCSFPLVA